jgi:multidrug efflux pump subunit AcrA (membrane-fusion protein)
MTLVPGMLAQVEVVTGERTALRYILDPIIDSFHRAMKEK